MPTVQFPIAVSGDDAKVENNGDATYPPASANGWDELDTTNSAQKSQFSSLHILGLQVFRWDTSSIPDDATVTDAVFRARGTLKTSPDSRSITLEYYAYDGSVDGSDYTTTVGTSAHAGRTIASLSASADEDFTLLSPAANINKSGYTGLRMHVSGGAASAETDNYWQIASWDHATLDPPRLIVTYEVDQGSANVAWFTA